MSAELPNTAGTSITLTVQEPLQKGGRGGGFGMIEKSQGVGEVWIEKQYPLDIRAERGP